MRPVFFCPSRPQDRQVTAFSPPPADTRSELGVEKLESAAQQDLESERLPSELNVLPGSGRSTVLRRSAAFSVLLNSSMHAYLHDSC